MTTRPLVAVLMAAGLASGCGAGASSAAGPSGSARPSAPVVSTDKATVRLGVVYAGGPAGASSLLRPGRVTLVGTGALPRIVPVEEGKRTPVQVAPGFYLVSASSGDAACVTTQVTVRAGPPTDVTVTCSVK